ncbi:NUMOD4 domain-containing protein [Bacillus wiedmannii]|uniref:NUMOD4 domain-containing protein n=1 Tax=Bacillus wiedmannii TaxID=1890302 RepID=UPI000BF139D3|nr:NUMOD4 domain-containing protein [Bacillus wiedmannii]PEO38310.1 endonuclease [Bacillus wiedmannii]
MELEKEVWKDIEGYEDLYQVSNLGRVKSLDRDYIDSLGRKRTSKGRTLRPVRLNGYQGVSLCREGSDKKERIHRLVAKAFLPIPLFKDTVNHINGIKNDNRVENLEWVTQSENAQHAHDTGLNTSGKSVAMLSDDGEILKVFPTTVKAGEFLGDKSYRRNISMCARGAAKTAYGYKWSYLEEEISIETLTTEQLHSEAWKLASKKDNSKAIEYLQELIGRLQEEAS